MATLQTVDTRAAGTDFPAGKAYFETSTNKFIVWNGESWIELHSDGTGAAFSNQYSLSFDGSDDYLDCGTISALNNTSNFTISFWLNFQFVTGSTVMSAFTSGNSTSNRVEFVFNSSNELRFGVDSSVNNCILNISSYTSTDAWHHITGTYDGSNVSLFFDGSQVSTTTLSVPSTTSSTHGNDTTLGRRTLGGGSFYFNGLMDEVAIFSSALSTPQVASLIDSSGTNPVPADLSSFINNGLAAWYRMGDDSSDTFVDGGSVASITDSSGNGNTATQGTVSARPTFSSVVPS